MTGILQGSLVADGDDGGFVDGRRKPHSYLQQTPKVHPKTSAGQGGRKRDSAKEPHKGQTAATEATTAERTVRNPRKTPVQRVNSEGTEKQGAHSHGENRKGAHSGGAYGEGAETAQQTSTARAEKEARKDSANCSGYSYIPESGPRTCCPPEVSALHNSRPWALVASTFTRAEVTRALNLSRCYRPHGSLAMLVLLLAGGGKGRSR